MSLRTWHDTSARTHALLIPRMTTNSTVDALKKIFVRDMALIAVCLESVADVEPNALDTKQANMQIHSGEMV